MVKITFEAHCTTLDNEEGLCSGWNDVELSPLGEQRAKEMGLRHANDTFDMIFCSDLQRSYNTAKIAFGDIFKITQDARLRECDYGDLTQYSSTEVEAEKINRIYTPFPNGESYIQTSERMKDFLNFLSKNYEGKRVLIIGHRATQYALEYWINGVQYEQLVSSKFIWQPGWEYQLYFDNN